MQAREAEQTTLRPFHFDAITTAAHYLHRAREVDQRHLLQQDDEVQAREAEHRRSSRQNDEVRSREAEQRRRSSRQDAELRARGAEQRRLLRYDEVRPREADHIRSHPSFNNTANMNPPEQEESQEQQVIQNPEYIVPPRLYYRYLHLRWKFRLTQ